MPIQVACQCGQRFAAKDELAGRTVKCPKCGSPLAIPRPSASQPAPPPGGPAGYTGQGFAPPGAYPQQPYPDSGYTGGGFDPLAQPGGSHAQSWLGTGAASSGGGGLGDLFDEAGMSAPAHTGPRCPGCAAPMRPEAIICVQCGYNMALGRRMETIAGQDVGSATPGGETARLMAKAQQEVAEAPPAETATDFGEGASAYILTCGMLAAMVMFLVAGGVTMWVFDTYITSVVSPSGMLVISSQILLGVSWIWMTIYAFTEKTSTGVLMLLFGNCLCGLPMLVYGFMKMDSLLWPFIMVCLAYLLGIGGGVTGGLSGGE